MSPRLTAEDERAIKAALDNLAAGRCPTCGAPVEPSTVIGRCAYASCGHLIGQVAPSAARGRS